MLFNSDAFLFLFLPAVLVGFFFLKNRIGAVPAQLWLALASVVFYGFSGWRFLPLLLAAIAVNFVLGRTLAHHAAKGERRKGPLVLGIALNLLVLSYFKYSDFIAANLEALTGMHFSFGRVELPVGISFYTFTQIAFLVDAAKGEAKEYDLPRYALFVTFFPHLIAGPIIHHKEMMPQFTPENLRRRCFKLLPQALTLFTIGLAKKVILADSFASYSTPIFDAALRGSTPDLIASWSAALCYAFQIYFDFSGYSDMALGLALMFGIRLPVNFYSPYKSESIVEFWRRWHMTLSRFLRDYLYYPLGGNRKGPLRRYLNLLIVMLLGGLWHGAGWTFLLWGGLHGCYLMGNHFWRFLVEKNFAVALPRTLAKLVTFVAVVAAWVLFRAENVQAAGALYRGMLGLNGISVAYDLLKLFNVHAAVQFFGLEITPLSFDQDLQWQALLMCIAGSLIVWSCPSSMEIARMEPWPAAKTFPRWRFETSEKFALATGAVLFLCIGGINAGAVSEFIYFKF
jgi:alginate O-acetyltransferase complex protein AlgI